MQLFLFANHKLKHIKAKCKSKPQYNQQAEKKNKACNLKTRNTILFNKQIDWCEMKIQIDGYGLLHFNWTCKLCLVQDLGLRLRKAGRQTEKSIKDTYPSVLIKPLTVPSAYSETMSPICRKLDAESDIFAIQSALQCGCFSLIFRSRTLFLQTLPDTAGVGNGFTHSWSVNASR